MRPPGPVRLTPVALSLALVSCQPASDGGDEPGGEPVNPPLVVGSDTLPPAQVQESLARRLGFASRGGRVFCGYTTLGRETSRVFVWWLCREMVQRPDSIEPSSGSGGPAVLEVDTAADPARITRIRVPGDGAAWSRDIEAMFPRDVVRRIHASTAEQNRRASRLMAAVRREAAAFYRRDP